MKYKYDCKYITEIEYYGMPRKQLIGCDYGCKNPKMIEKYMNKELKDKGWETLTLIDCDNCKYYKKDK